MEEVVVVAVDKDEVRDQEDTRRLKWMMPRPRVCEPDASAD